MKSNLETLNEILHKAGIRLGEGRHTRAGYTKPSLNQRRSKRRKKNKAAKRARKRNR